ncbi:MAG TPA: hypothetical protein VGM37_10870 [Armatimonadota bacterium]|jgi:alpha-mannosidase
MNEKDPLGHDRADGGGRLGLQTVRYAVLPHGGTREKDKAWREAHAFQAPLRDRQMPVAGRGNIDHNRREMAGVDTSTRACYLATEPEQLALSAFRRARDREATVARFWNIGAAAVRGALTPPGAKAAPRVYLNEDRQEDLPVDVDGTASVSVWPKRIVTVEFAV